MCPRKLTDPAEVTFLHKPDACPDAQQTVLKHGKKGGKKNKAKTGDWRTVLTKFVHVFQQKRLHLIAIG